MRLRYPVVLGLALSALIAPGQRASGQPAPHAPQDASASASAIPDAGTGDNTAADTGAGASAGGQAVSICVKPQPGAARDTLLVIPSGTVLVGQTMPAGRRQSAQMEAVVTTETVTLTEMQPCSGADASTLVSRTRHWLVDPVRPQAAVVLHPVGEVSGNGVDTSFEEEPDAFRSAVKTGAITAHVQGTLKETVALTETQADIPEEPDNSMGPDWAHSTGWDQNSLRKTPGSRTE